MQTLRHFLEMVRFSHTLFALPFALASAVLAWRDEPFRGLDLAGILVCMVLARSAAMGFNRLVDRQFDAANPRTAGRHLPAGKLSVASVWGFTLACAGGFVAATLFFVVSNDNWLPLTLAVPVLVFIAAYSLTKRFTALSHFWLGCALMLAPAAAWIAITGSLDWTPIVLGLAVLCWVAGFDILYACQDVDFDRQVGLHSVPAALGVAWSLRLAMLLHLAMAGVLLVLGVVASLGTIYFVGVALVAGLLIWEHWLVRPSDLSRINQAFFHVNAVISVGLLVIVTVDVIMQ